MFYTSQVVQHLFYQQYVLRLQDYAVDPFSALMEKRHLSKKSDRSFDGVYMNNPTNISIEIPNIGLMGCLCAKTTSYHPTGPQLPSFFSVGKTDQLYF